MRSNTKERELMINIAHLSNGATIPLCPSGVMAWRNPYTDASFEVMAGARVIKWETIDAPANTIYICYDCGNTIEDVLPEPIQTQEERDDEWNAYTQANHQDLNENVETAQDLANFILGMFEDLHTSAHTYGDSSWNSGTIIELDNGAKFQITVVREHGPTLTACMQCGIKTDDVYCETCEDEAEAN